MADAVRVFIGYDPKEAAAYHVCSQSLIERSSLPLALHPLALNNLAGAYTEWHTDGSNAFIYSRFLVPYLCGFSGCAIYLDGDMLVRADIAQLWKLRRGDRGVAVVKHEYRTRFPVKYLGQKNENYPRKNWSSVMLWNCSFFPHRKLTPEFVAQQKGSYLHRFKWLRDEQIEALPAQWNHLCLEYPPDEGAKLLHYTVGLPPFPGYDRQEGAREWFDTADRAMAPMPREAIKRGREWPLLTTPS